MRLATLQPSFIPNEMSPLPRPTLLCERTQAVNLCRGQGTPGAQTFRYTDAPRDET